MIDRGLQILGVDFRGEAGGAMAASAIGLVYRNHCRKLRTNATAPANRKV